LNQESEAPQPNKQYVMLDAGHRKFIAIPFDSFIEMNGDIIVFEQEGYGDDAQLNLDDAPLNFKLISYEQITALRVKARMTDKKK